METRVVHDTAGPNAAQLLLLLASIASVFCIYPLAGLLLQPQGHGFSAGRMAPDFELRDFRGQVRTLADYRGRHVFLVFGYLHCDDVCHAQSGRLAALAGLLEGHEIEFLYLAMDSRRDEPSMLHAYFDRRGANFTSLHADEPARMQALASKFNAPYRIAGNPGADDYEIEHPARIFLLGPDGRMLVVYNATATSGEQIAEDFRRLAGNPPT